MYKLLLETEHFIAVDKACDVSFQGQHEGRGLLSRIRADFGSQMIFPTHRLDKMTSGVLLLAKGSAANKALSVAFQERRVEKYYLALSDLKPKKKQGSIIGDMARSRRGEWCLLRERTNPAITQFFSYSIKPGLRLFLLKPHTGRTHQLRVALKSIGAPVIGDPYYHQKSLPEPDRAYLHAYALRFTLDDEHYCIRSLPEQGQLFLDDQVKALIDVLEQPWSLDWPLIKNKK
jgi:tRNA pseudouridine32 synthase/23S rRNA pseudouridine746 synthase